LTIVQEFREYRGEITFLSSQPRFFLTPVFLGTWLSSPLASSPENTATSDASLTIRSTSRLLDGL